MLCGYLPFDDDPSNPDGDNINLLYKYILETRLEFPDHVSNLARDLMNRMLVPDPKYRATMKEVINHRWLNGVRHYFDIKGDSEVLYISVIYYLFDPFFINFFRIYIFTSINSFSNKVIVIICELKVNFLFVANA